MQTSIADGEHNDCAVRALSVACGLSYDHAHSKFAAAGRRHRGRTKLVLSDEVYSDAGLTQHHCDSMTVGLFLSIHKRFTGILHVRGHMIGVNDGSIIDWVSSDSRRIVNDYWTVSRPASTNTLTAMQARLNAALGK
jgi:hypothetical protein